ncbi:MAG: cold shock domain-containing protein [Planctomycetota bacterium]
MNATGTVKWFDNRKGFGFLRTEGVDEDIFVHYSNVVGDGFRCLRDGETVEFVLEQGDKGFHALEVRKQDQPETAAEPDRAEERVLSRA